jgi:hypothetical protein
VKIFETAAWRGVALALPAVISLALPFAAHAHHGNPGENLWHDIVYLLSSPGIVLLIAAALVGLWIVVRRLRQHGGKKA